ncbi:MAG TPA: DUF4388 domain-containing protein [Vicinamibacteria bacterium]|nr:DUF4388 domain-containing protein [Vicinamibacteria bacterium]
MALEGTIRDFGLPDIFQLIGLQRKTGILTLRNEKETVTVTFENGMVVMADSSAKRLEDRLGGVLVKQGRLGKERLEEALQTQKATLQRLGHVLTTQNYITDADLREALLVQVSQIVFKVFRWRDGDYHFAPTDAVEYDHEHFSPLSTDFIIMEGIRMVDEWPIIEKKIPSLDIVLRPVVDTSLIEVKAEGEEESSRATPSNKIRLSPQEELIFRRVDGTRTVQGIIDITGLPEFDTCRTLFDLLNRNLITTVGRGAQAVPEAGRVSTGPSAVAGYAIVAGLFVLALLGGAYRFRSPFAVTGLRPFVSQSRDQVLDGVLRTRLHRLDAAVQAYHLLLGTAPRTLEDVALAGLVDRSYLKDPWARPFHYALTHDGYLLSAVDDKGKNLPSTLIERGFPTERP